MVCYCYSSNGILAWKLVTENEEKRISLTSKQWHGLCCGNYWANEMNVVTVLVDFPGLADRSINRACIL